MFKYFLLIISVLNFYSYATANENISKEYVNKIYDEYDDCIYIYTEKYNKLTLEYDLDIYSDVPEKSKYNVYQCNSIFKKLINNEAIKNNVKIDFNSQIEKAIKNNFTKEKNIYLKIYHLYHYNIIWYSENKSEIKDSLIEIENNYLKKSNLLINKDAAKMMGSLGWFYNVNKYFFNFEKAHDYLQKAVAHTTDEHFLKYYINNLGVIYDQDRYGNESTKKNNKISFELYTKAAEKGLHHAYSNLGKFYLLGLGGVKKDYDKTIKYYKLARIASFGDDDLSDLKILYNKKRLPNNLSEYLNWLEEHLINNQDSFVFQQLAWIADENELRKNNTSDFISMYKWQYLCSLHCKSYIDRDRAISELFILKKENLTNIQINKAILIAKKWEEKNWNKHIKITKANKTIEKKNKLVDIIKNAFMKN